MSDADTLWDAVKDRYDDQSIISLTNVRNRAAGATADSVGLQAAQDVIDSFPLYGQIAFDIDSPTHVQVAINGVITFLWARGGSSAKVQALKMEEWEKLVERLKNTDPRAHAEPRSNSTLSTPAQEEGSGRRYPWAHRRNFRGLLPKPAGPHSTYGGPDEWE